MPSQAPDVPQIAFHALSPQRVWPSVAALLLLISTSCSSALEDQPPANIVWITVDTLRADHLGCYGYFRETSPRIDALAKQSILFEDCVVPMATTFPSHLSMLTGTLPLEHGALANAFEGGQKFIIPESLVSFAEVMADVGYATAGFISSKPLQTWTGISKGFQEYSGPEGKERRGEETVSLALDWLQQQAQAKGDQPFFLWVHLFDPHASYAAPEGFRGLFPADAKLDAYLGQRSIPETASGPDAPLQDTRKVHGLYDEEVLYTDGQIGRLLDAIDEQGLAHNTAVVFISDHGEGLGQHGVPRHGVVWNEQVHAPFILRLPGETPRRVAAPVSAIDLFPTLVKALDLPGCESFIAQGSGVDVLAEGFDGRVQWAQSSMRMISHGQPVIYSLRKGRWKFNWAGKGTAALYDLNADPFELQNVVKQHPKISARMRAELLASRTQQKETGKAFGAGAKAELDAKIQQDLRDLGYTGKK